MLEDIQKAHIKAVVDLFGYDAIPRQRYMSRVQDLSGLSYSQIGMLMKKYDRRLIVAAILFCNKYNKADKIDYVVSIIERMKYFLEARKGIGC